MWHEVALTDSVAVERCVAVLAATSSRLSNWTAQTAAPIANSKRITLFMDATTDALAVIAVQADKRRNRYRALACGARGFSTLAIAAEEVTAGLLTVLRVTNAAQLQVAIEHFPPDPAAGDLMRRVVTDGRVVSQMIESARDKQTWLIRPAA